jgi:hypothetical protein
MKAMPEKKFYPDANSTMRLTYGTVDKLPIRKTETTSDYR